MEFLRVQGPSVDEEGMNLYHEEPCYDCAEGQPEGCCPASQAPCGHHCNCAWVQDQCCWCGQEFGEA